MRDVPVSLMVERARVFRVGATPAERVMWRALRSRQLGYRFRRQAPIGMFIVDFLCAERRLIVEIDGVTHADEAVDAGRTAWLSGEGYRVLRFWNSEVLGNLEGVVARVVAGLGG